MTVAACMIVKNESQVIVRCLDSLRGLVQAVVIVDTGSTDDTLQVIRRLAYPVPIHLHQRPWKNFAHNRTELLRLASPVADYLLLLDADQTVAGRPSPLSADAYSLPMRRGRLEYRNILLIRSSLPWRYEGVTHEYVICESAAPAVPLDALLVIDHDDGGRRPAGTQPRWEWDAQVLEEELAREPNNTRYVFYLARTYEDLAVTRPNDAMAGEWRKRAMARYQHRTRLAGYGDEVFYSFLRLGVMRLSEGDGLVYLLQAWQHRPHRWEPVYEACRCLNQRGLYQASYALSKQVLTVPARPSGLFAFPDVYDHLLLFEHAISAYYVDQYRESLEANRTLLAKVLPRHLEEAVRRNIEFPRQRLADSASGGRQPPVAA